VENIAFSADVLDFLLSDSTTPEILFKQISKYVLYMSGKYIIISINAHRKFRQPDISADMH